MRKMKDSGVEWIGVVPRHWGLSKIKHVTEWMPRCARQGLSPESLVGYTPMDCIKRGYFIRNTAQYGDIPPSLTAYEPGDIVVAKVTPCFENGNIALMTDIGADIGFGSSELFVLRARAISKKFLFYWLQNSGFIDMAKASMTGMGGLKRVSSATMRNAVIALPPVEEQRSIFLYLDAKCAEIDALTADIEEQIETLEKYKQSVITETVTKGLDPDAPMKDSGVEWIGEVPETWDLGRLKHVASSGDYPIGDGDHGLIRPEDYVEDGIPYIRVMNLTWSSGLSWNGMAYITDEDNNRIRRSQLRPGDILIAKTGATIGKTAIVPNNLTISNTTAHVGKVTVDASHCSSFFYYLLSSSVIQLQIGFISAMQTTRPELGIERLKNLVVLIPPRKEQKAIVAYLDAKCDEIDGIIAAKREQLETIAEYKKSLIFEYVTGKKEVPAR